MEKGLYFTLSGSQIIEIMKKRIQEHGNQLSNLEEEKEKLKKIKELEVCKVELTPVYEIEYNILFHKKRIKFLEFWSSFLNSENIFNLSDFDLERFELIEMKLDD